MRPLVSVIIPVYNGAAFVAEAVQSAIDQEDVAKEIIVINDGSTDDTLTVLRGFGDRIRLIDQKNSGPPAARNAGLHAAHGDFIAFLDADDVWINGKLATQVAYLEAHPEVGMVFNSWHIWQPEPDGMFRWPDAFRAPINDLAVDAEHSGWIYNRLLFECEALTTTVMLRAAVARTVGDFDVTMFCGEDYDYWIRVSRIAQISKLKSVGALYRVVPSSVSRNPRETNAEYEVIHKALTRWGLVGPNGTETPARAMERRLEDLVLSHAIAHLNHGDPRLALAAFRGILSRHPAKAKLWLYVLRAMIRIG